MSRRALVTGGAGFVGQWLCRALVRAGWDVCAAGTGARVPEPGVLSGEQIAVVRWIETDIRDNVHLGAAIDAARPDAVFHLAGLSYIPEARDAPALTYEVNVLGAVRLLAELARRRRAGMIDPTILVVGSATQYGRHDAADMPLTESAEQRPAEVYAGSKAAQEIAALQAARAEGLRVVCTRSFNHSGRGHAEHFLLPALVRRAIALRERGGGELRLGNQDSVRDYLHVDDVVAAYVLLAERGAPGEAYNVCSGIGVTVRELARDVLLRVGTTAEITTDQSLVRGVDVPVLVGSPEKLRRSTGWQPTRTHADIIDDLINAATL